MRHPDEVSVARLVRSPEETEPGLNSSLPPPGRGSHTICKPSGKRTPHNATARNITYTADALPSGGSRPTQRHQPAQSDTRIRSLLIPRSKVDPFTAHAREPVSRTGSEMLPDSPCATRQLWSALLRVKPVSPPREPRGGGAPGGRSLRTRSPPSRLPLSPHLARALSLITSSAVCACAREGVREREREGVEREARTYIPSGTSATSAPRCLDAGRQASLCAASPVR